MRRFFWLAAVCLFALAAWSVAYHPWGWLYAVGVHPYPASSSTPWTYQMWSGIIPALTIVSLLGSLGAAYHLHNCHEDGCWRLGKHRVSGTPWCGIHVGGARQETTDSDRLDKLIDLLDALVAKS